MQWIVKYRDAAFKSKNKPAKIENKEFAAPHFPVFKHKESTQEENFRFLMEPP